MRLYSIFSLLTAMYYTDTSPAVTQLTTQAAQGLMGAAMVLLQRL